MSRFFFELLARRDDTGEAVWICDVAVEAATLDEARAKASVGWSFATGSSYLEVADEMGGAGYETLERVGWRNYVPGRDGADPVRAGASPDG